MIAAYRFERHQAFCRGKDATKTPQRPSGRQRLAARSTSTPSLSATTRSM